LFDEWRINAARLQKACKMKEAGEIAGLLLQMIVAWCATSYR
jgi:hypothetical protein